MGKKKWHDDRDWYLTRIMELLNRYEDVINIGQDEYKGDFFKIFADAYRSGFCVPRYRLDRDVKRSIRCKSQRPLVSGDAIWSFAKNRDWVHSEMSGTEKRYEDIRRVMTWWDEWTYAWLRNPPTRRYRGR
jgi:hypothetical protein